MTISELKTALEPHRAKQILFKLPDGVLMPSHFHITEIGVVKKEFVDCGGTIRMEGKCLLQAWVADDTDHRIDCEKFLQIFEHGRPVIPTEALPIEVEYEHPVLSQFPLERIEFKDDTVTLVLATKHTDCLAKDVCGVEESDCCTPGGGCC
ncbi:MAG: DUF6428 family protein [Verrucomicrobia bacterium]|nr:DUF6428 family protein [Verrucomicrobiota bacterium]MDA1065147.1 DUF6428 family protein [Verrucomicrobiota bacterium]